MGQGPQHKGAIRRKVMKTLGAGACALALPGVRAQAPAIRFGQSMALTGPLSEIGLAMHAGSTACFRAVNTQGGVHGRAVEVDTRDDAYDVPRAVANVDAFIADPSVFGLFTCMGTPMVAATLPQVKTSGIPYFTPLTGALLARPKDARNVFNIRASYPEEAEQLVKLLVTIGLRRIAIVYQNNSFGMEVFDAAKAALVQRSMDTAAAATVENDARDVDKAVGAVAASNADAVLVAMAGKPAMEFIRKMRQERKGIPLYATSVMGTGSSIKALGRDGIGITVSQVVPVPTATALAIVRDFMRDWAASKTSLDPSHVALEGYINARVLVEALRRSGRTPTRAAFLDACWGMRSLDLGGFRVEAREPGTNASRFVELTMVSANGRFTR